MLGLVVWWYTRNHRWRMLLSKSHWSESGWEISITAFKEFQVHQTWLSSGSIFNNTLCGSRWLLLQSMAGEKYGSSKWECYESHVQFDSSIYSYSFQRWFVPMFYRHYIIYDRNVNHCCNADTSMNHTLKSATHMQMWYSSKVNWPIFIWANGVLINQLKTIVIYLRWWDW